MQTHTLTTRQYMDKLVKYIEKHKEINPDFQGIAIKKDIDRIEDMRERADKSGQAEESRFAWKHNYDRDVVWIVFTKENDQWFANVNDGRPDWIQDTQCKHIEKSPLVKMMVPQILTNEVAKLINEYAAARRREAFAMKLHD